MFSAGSSTLFNQSHLSVEKKPSVTIRAATLADIDALSWVVIECYKQTYRLLEFRATDKLDHMFGCDYREKQLPSELNNSNFQYLICEDDAGRTVGFSKVKYNDNHAYLDKLYLLRDYQGTGDGHRLLIECFKLAAERGLFAMSLVVWDKNTKAQSFYKRHGFEVIGGPVQHYNQGDPTPYNDLLMVCSDVRPFLADAPRPK